MVPMNFIAPGATAAYADTGHWANEAITYATYYGGVKIIASSRETGYDRLPPWPTPMAPDYSYLHLTTNNTIYGTQYRELPHTSVPLVADVSSDIFGIDRPYQQLSLFYAAVQKNLGTPGLAMVALRTDFLEQAAWQLPPMLSYRAQVKEKGILNTANVAGTYTTLLMLRWTRDRGLQQIYRDSEAKASLLYHTIDNSSLYVPQVAIKEHRSNMNVTFTLRDPALEPRFAAACREQGIVGIEGHRSVGGYRVSIYNAMPIGDVATLVQVMQEVERKG